MGSREDPGRGTPRSAPFLELSGLRPGDRVPSGPSHFGDLPPAWRGLFSGRGGTSRSRAAPGHAGGSGFGRWVAHRSGPDGRAGGGHLFRSGLKVSTEEAVRRARAEGPTRPLLSTADSLGKARALLKEREPYYKRADVALDSTGVGAEELAETIQKLINEVR